MFHGVSGRGFGGGSGGCDCWWSEGRIEDRLPGFLPRPRGRQVEGDAPGGGRDPCGDA